MQPKKILIVRFSSIGDLVLTTPVIRCVAQQLQGAEVHVVTRAAFASVLQHNPHVHKLHTFKKDVGEIYEALKAEQFDVVIDLHRNLRSLRLKLKLKAKSYAFNKINLRKLFAVNFKMLNLLPPQHIVERYFGAVAPLGVKSDGKGLDYFLGKEDEVNVSTLLPSPRYIALVVGGSYYTKKIPINKLQEICEKAQLPIILLGGKEDLPEAEALQQQFPALINACGKYSINQSASLIKQAEWVITSDTGLMHMAAAYHKKIISVWGNTIPQFGMGPYLPEHQNQILEVKGLSCRPCSKLGYAKCPLGHFKCMNEIDMAIVSELE